MSGDSETSADVQRAVESERAELVSTLDQLRENLKPQNVVDEVMASAKLTTAEIGDRVWAVARSNPIPAALIGIGAAMLLGVGQTLRSRSVARVEDWDGGDSPSGRGQALTGAGSPGRNTVAAELHDAGSRVSASAARIAASARALRDQASRSTRRATNSNSGDQDMSQYSRSRDQISESVSRLFEEQPLVLAALGVAVGAAIGAAIPSTEAEGRLMGDASVQLKTRAQELAAAEYAHLKETAGATVSDLKRTVSEHGVSTDNLSGLVQDAGSRVRDAANDVASHAADTAGLKS
jgi:Protein of unknown function (DUF3618)